MTDNPDMNELDQKPAAVLMAAEAPEEENLSAAPVVDDTNPNTLDPSPQISQEPPAEAAAPPQPEAVNDNNNGITMAPQQPDMKKQLESDDEAVASETFVDEHQSPTKDTEETPVDGNTQPTLKDPPPSPAADEAPAEAPKLKSPPPPVVEPKDVQDEKAKLEAGGDAEEGGVAAAKDRSAAPKKPAAKKDGSNREMNPKFKDVQDTGSWGGITTAEKVVLGLVAVGILVGVIVAVVVVVGKDNTKEEQVPAATQAPTPMATSLPAGQKLPLLLEELESNPVTASLAGSLSSDPSFYSGMTDDEAACADTPSECALSWALYKDEFPPETNSMVDRYALAALYYSLGGPNWKNNTNWLSDSSYCQWQGINCNRLGTEVEEIDLGENDLAGELPVELALINTTAVISLKQNQISGGLPGDVISSMSKLFVLYIQNNMLTGPIPDNLVNEEQSLALLFIHGNNFTGPFPEVYCPRDGPVFVEFSLDCTSKNECPEDCCNPSENCF